MNIWDFSKAKRLTDCRLIQSQQLVNCLAFEKSESVHLVMLTVGWLDFESLRIDIYLQ